METLPWMQLSYPPNKNFRASRLLWSVPVQKENGSIFHLKLYFRITSNQIGKKNRNAKKDKAKRKAGQKKERKPLWRKQQ